MEGFEESDNDLVVVLPCGPDYSHCESKIIDKKVE